MPGFSQRARVSGGDSVTGALRSYVANAASLVEEAVQDEQEQFLDRQRDRAQGDDQWSSLADQVDAWEDDEGNYAHGVRGDDQSVTQAGLLEFGDHRNPPSPLLRMGVLRDAANINWRLSDRFRRGGY